VVALRQVGCVRHGMTCGDGSGTLPTRRRTSSFYAPATILLTGCSLSLMPGSGTCSASIPQAVACRAEVRALRGDVLHLLLQ